jgi:hypothetical protein
MRNGYGSEQVVRGKVAFATILILAVLSSASCGDSTNVPPQTTSLSGNWLITLDRHANPAALTYSGFLVQSGNSVNGSVVLGDGCQGVGPVTGNVDGQNFQLKISEFGQDISLTGVLPIGNAPLSGQFSTLAGGCTQFASTGTFSAVQVAPLSGTFHGTLLSANPTSITPSLEVTGIIFQGPNTGDSNATLTGTVSAGSYVAPCAYLTNATIVGTVSGTNVVWSLAGPNGAPMGHIPLPGGLPGGPPNATISPDGTSLTGSYDFQPMSSTCLGDQGSVQLSFP